MSPTPEPRAGLYTDSCGTRYAATHEKRTGWWLQKMSGERGRPAAPFQKPDFQAACHAGVFTPSTEPI